MVKSLNRKDFLIFLFIFVMAALLRLPNLSYPPVSLGDEMIYAAYTTDIVHNINDFQIHPPLVPILFSLTAAKKSFPINNITNTGVPFDGFPYVRTRLLVAILGSLLPGVVYLLARSFGFGKGASLFVAMLVVFDNALIVFSRVMLPDLIMWFLSFSGLLLLVQSCNKSISRSYRYELTLFSSICFGLAVSVKWTALSMIGVAFLYLLLERSLIKIVPIVGTSIIIYLFIYGLFFSGFHAGPIDVSRNYFPVPYVNAIVVPDLSSIGNVANFFVDYTYGMFKVQEDKQFYSVVYSSGSPLRWPFGLSLFKMFNDPDGYKIGLFGNVLTWSFAFCMTVYSFFVFVSASLRKKLAEKDVSRTEIFLLGGFLLNYVPFFFINSRPVYLYAYIFSLIFSFLLIPVSFPRIYFQLTGNKKIPPNLIRFALAALVGLFIVFSPLTYGF